MTQKFKINTRLEKTTLAKAIAMAKKTSKITDFPQLPRIETPILNKIIPMLLQSDSKLSRSMCWCKK
jgi:hypothetical protein